MGDFDTFDVEEAVLAADASSVIVERRSDDVRDKDDRDVAKLSTVVDRMRIAA